MKGSEQVQLNGMSYTQRQCFVESLTHNPNNSAVWYNLGVSMNATEQAQVNGESYTRSQCMEEAVKHSQ